MAQVKHPQILKIHNTGKVDFLAVFFGGPADQQTKVVEGKYIRCLPILEPEVRWAVEIPRRITPADFELKEPSAPVGVRFEIYKLLLVTNYRDGVDNHYLVYVHKDAVIDGQFFYDVTDQLVRQVKENG